MPTCGCQEQAPEANHEMWACPCGSHCPDLQCQIESMNMQSNIGAAVIAREIDNETKD